MTIKKNTPLVSVVMATFNEPQDIIKKSIESIINQTYSNFELIIIDDSNSLETRNVIDSFSSDSRVKIIREDERIGFVKSLNIGLRLSQGLFIARMDGDDISVLNRLELQIAYLNEHPTISVVGGSFNIIDSNDKIISKRKYPVSAFFFILLALYRDPLAHPTVMMRRECVDNGFYYDESFSKAEDLELWLRLMKNGYKLANMKQYLLNYRIGGDLSKKRKNDHWSYNYRAKVKNFSFRRPIFSILSLAISYTYTIMPNWIIRAVYHNENNTR